MINKYKNILKNLVNNLNIKILVISKKLKI